MYNVYSEEWHLSWRVSSHLLRTLWLSNFPKIRIVLVSNNTSICIWNIHSLTQGRLITELFSNYMKIMWKNFVHPKHKCKYMSKSTSTNISNLKATLHRFDFLITVLPRQSKYFFHSLFISLESILCHTVAEKLLQRSFIKKCCRCKHLNIWLWRRIHI